MPPAPRHRRKSLRIARNRKMSRETQAFWVAFGSLSEKSFRIARNRKMPQEIRASCVSFGWLLGALGPLWGCLRGSVGVTWVAFGRSWGSSVGSLGVLGRSWGHLGSQGSILAGKRGSKGRPFGRQNGAKIDQKARCRFRSEKVASWKRFWMMSRRFLEVSVHHFCCFSSGFSGVS